MSEDPLFVRVDSAHEEPTWVSVPTLSSRSTSQVSGGVRYRIELQAIVTSKDEFERWRELLGKTLTIEMKDD